MEPKKVNLDTCNQGSIDQIPKIIVLFMNGNKQTNQIKKNLLITENKQNIQKKNPCSESL